MICDRKEMLHSGLLSQRKGQTDKKHSEEI